MQEALAVPPAQHSPLAIHHANMPAFVHLSKQIPKFAVECRVPMSLKPSPHVRKMLDRAPAITELCFQPQTQLIPTLDQLWYSSNSIKAVREGKMIFNLKNRKKRKNNSVLYQKQVTQIIFEESSQSVWQQHSSIHVSKTLNEMQSYNNSFFPPDLLLQTAAHTPSLSTVLHPRAFLQRNINIHLVLFISICTLTSKTHFGAPPIKKKVKCRLLLCCICSSSLFFSLQISSALFVLWDTSVQCRHFVIFAATHPGGAGIKKPHPAPCQGGTEVGAARTGAELAVGAGNGFAWKSPEQHHPAWLLPLELPAQRIPGCAPKNSQRCCVRAV